MPSYELPDDLAASIIEAAPDVILLVGPDGRIVAANARVQSMFGWPRTELVGQPVELLVPPDVRPRHAELRATYFAAPGVREMGARTNLLAVRRDGARLDVEIFLSPLRREGVTYVVAVVRDVGARRRMEAALADAQRATQRVEEHLRQAQKMEALGRLAGGVAHDFNNLMTALLGYGDLALLRMGAQDPLRPCVEQMKRAGERAAALTRQLLAFSRKQVLQPQVLRADAILDDLEDMLRRLIGGRVDLAMVPSRQLGSVRVDPSQLEQVVVNLVVNARDAMPDGGKLTIETKDVTLDATYAASHPEVNPGPYVLLAVTDTGHGMGPEVLGRLFEPFFTTKPSGQGTGLGLSTVYGIVKQSGGHIAVYSEVGRGTTFKVYLPRVDVAPSPSLPGPEHARRALGGTETILLVEDDHAVRQLVRDVLMGLGYRVLEAATPSDAVLLARGCPDTIHLLLTDVVMPGMNGVELQNVIVPTRPGLKVLYMSGYTENAIIHQGALDPGIAFIAKPFSPAALGQKVRELLDA